MMMILPQRLEGAHVVLDPVAEGDREEMRDLLDSDPDIWEIYAVSGYREHFQRYWDLMLNMPDRLSFAVRDRATGRLVGTSSMFLIDPAHRSLEIGYTWYRADARGTFVNPETKLLMLGHAFAGGALRVQFTVDTRNARSVAAMTKIALREGTLRRHKVTWTGYKRDSAVFSVTDEDWPEVEAKLRARLAA